MAIKVRKECLDHAENLIESAKRVLGIDNGFPNIAYHLSLLAMEEIGKAQMIISGAISGKPHTSWPFNKLDDHIHKLMWALWSPTMLSNQIDAKSFNEAKELAYNFHSKRIKGLYVNFDQSVEDHCSPANAVHIDDVQSILNIAQATLSFEKGRNATQIGLPNTNLDWFLETVSDSEGQNLLFSKSFIKKLEQLNEPVEWIAWARAEIEKIKAEEIAILGRERTKLIPEKGAEKPRWVFNIRLKSRWHAIRQKPLNNWNNLFPFAKFEKPKEFNEGEFLLKLTLRDNIKVDDIFDAGFILSKLILACLNIGTGGFIWFHVSEGQDRYFDKIKDLENPNMKIVIGKPSGLACLTLERSDRKGKKHKDTLTEAYMNGTITCFLAFSTLTNEENEPIFGPYFQALVLLSKSDLHLSCEEQAKQSFINCLSATMKHFGNWDGHDKTLTDSINTHISEVVIKQEHRDKLLEPLDQHYETSKPNIFQAFQIKQLADLCLSVSAQRILSKT